MKSSRFFFATLSVAVALAFSSCGPDRQKMLSEIEQMEVQLLDPTMAIDSTTVLQLVSLYDQYIENFPDDSMSQVYLYSSAERMINIGDNEEAVERFNRIIARYPDYDGIPYCYFFKAFALEQASRIEEAINAYEEFLQRYPNHFLADGLRTTLPLMRQGLDNNGQLKAILEQKGNATEE